MVIRVKRYAVSVAANHLATLFKSLLVSVVALFTQGLPVGLIPEQSTRFSN